MLVVGRRVFPALLWQITRTGSRELFTLSVVAAALTIAWGASALFGVSFALGAFFAGMVLRESGIQPPRRRGIPPAGRLCRFVFVSVGMLFNPTILIEQPVRVLAVVAVIMIGKIPCRHRPVVALRYPISAALSVSASLAQIGEFSFILASLGVSGPATLEGKTSFWPERSSLLPSTHCYLLQ